MRCDRGSFRGCQPVENIRDFARVEYLVAVGLDEIPKPSRQDIFGKVGFQFAIANEKYDGMETGFREVEKFFKRLRVPVVLVNRVLKLEFLSVDGLRPFR